jgi:hypothetical protein
VLLGRKCGSLLVEPVVGSLVLMWWLIVWSNNYVLEMWLILGGDQ